MPFTPYHFGASGFLALVFKRWIDLPVFLAANVAVDVEVLFANGWPQHQHWHFHTLLIGGLVGAGLGAAMFPFGKIFGMILEFFKLPYETGFKKMLVSGILGVWLHVFIDSFYHWDVEVFWPSKAKPLWNLVNSGFASQDAVQSRIRTIGIGFACAFLFVYAIGLARARSKNKKTDTNKN